MAIKNTITNAADITVLNLIDNTFKTGGGPASVGGCVVEATKGPVMTPLTLTAANWQDTLGKPMPMKVGARAEGLRHLSEAAESAEKIVAVRVVAEDALIPAIGFSDDDEAPTVKSQHGFGTEIVAGVGLQFIIWRSDGDPAVGSKVDFSWDADSERGTLKLYDLDKTNTSVLVETLVFGFNQDDVDDLGRPAYIESVFEQQSSYLAVDAADVVDTAKLYDVSDITFDGGTNGGTPTTEDYQAAWEIFDDMRVYVTELFAAGNYDPLVIAYAQKIADGRHCEFRYDVPPYLDQAAAIQWQLDAAIQSRQSSPYWNPYTAIDPWYGTRALWGVSGSAVAAKARGNANFTGAIPGVHYAPAGTKRGYIDRRSVRSLFPTDVIDKDALYDARINPVLANDNGVGTYIGDALTSHYYQNYSRFNWVTAIDNYITHRFIEAAGYAKFEPDGLTFEILNRLMRDIRSDMITSGALVPPRDPDTDGDDPMVIEIVQEEIDLWMVSWEFCPTGAARRIAGQPIMVK